MKIFCDDDRNVSIKFSAVSLMSPLRAIRTVLRNVGAVTV